MTKFSPEEVAAVYRAIAERRDMRHFLPDPVDSAVLQRLLEAAHLAPSVGFMQPWRFLRITDTELRKNIHGLVDKERVKTAEALGERSDEFMKLKVEGVMQCAELLVVFLMQDRDKYIFGRRTLPEMDLASAACAIQNMWLAARVEGIGMGWVSLFEPTALAELLGLPGGSKPIAILCLGHVEEFYDRPMLEETGWDSRRDLHSLVRENRWNA